jgi:CHAT domain-containing protein/tetratricopeptide (TPR) repeat protein
MPSPRRSLVCLGLALCLARTLCPSALAQVPSTPEMGGIGIQSQRNEKAKQLVIQEVIPDGPAAKAGLQAGDIVLEVDGKTVVGESQSQMISRVRGAIGTSVKIKVQRGKQIFTTMIIRGKIQVSPPLSEKQQADQLFDQGNQAYQKSDFRDAVEKWNQALKIYSALGNKQSEGLVYSNLGLAYDALGEYQQAIKYQNLRLQVALELGDKQGEGNAYGNLGAGYQSLGDYQKALEYQNKRLQIVLQLGDKQGEGIVYSDLGTAYELLGEYPKAIEYENKSLQIMLQIGNKQGEGVTYGNLGNTYYALGEYQKAIEYLNKSLQIALQLGSKQGEGTVYGNLGIVYLSLGNYQKAIEYQNKRLKIALQTSDKQGEGNAYGNLGNAYKNLGDYQKAIEYQNKRLQIALQIGDKQGESQVYGNLGIAYYALGSYQQAIEYHQKALQIDLQIHDKKGEGQDYGNLGVVYSYLGDFPKAIDYHNKRLQIALQIGDRAGEGSAYGNLATIYLAQGEYQKAMEYQNKRLQIALQIGDKQGEGQVYGNLGTAYEKLKRYDEALLLQQKAIAIFSELGNKQDLYYPQWTIARILNAQEKPDLAILFYKQAINTIQATKERIRDLDPALKKSFGESKSILYRELADLLLKQGRVLEAQKVFDLLKEQETIEYLRSALRSSATGANAQLNDSEQKLWQEYTSSILGKELKLYQQRSEIAAQMKRIPVDERDNNSTYQALKLKFKEAQEKVDALTPAFSIFLKQAAASLKSSDAPATAEQLQKDVDKYKNLLTNRKAALISPLVLPDRLELILLTPNLKPLQRTVKISKAELDRLVLRLRQNLANPRGDMLMDLQQLYQWLVAPFEPEIQQLLKDKTIDTLAFAPDDNLRLIPMAALHDGKQYLIEKLPIGVIDRLSTLADKSSSPSQMLAMGLSKSQSQYPEFSALPGVSEEVRSIGKLYKKPVLLDERFTKEQLKEALVIATGDGQPLMLHIATHASFGVNKEKTFILMFKDKLTLDDLQGLELRNVSLLTLSACETASTDGRSGIGLASVAEASGGAQSVLGSLWPVNDLSTSLLMQRLYANLKAGMPKAKALQQAQLTLIQGQTSANSPTDPRGGVVPLPKGTSPSTTSTFSHPFYWAPFILMGDWR